MAIAGRSAAVLVAAAATAAFATTAAAATAPPIAAAAGASVLGALRHVWRTSVKYLQQTIHARSSARTVRTRLFKFMFSHKLTETVGCSKVPLQTAYGENSMKSGG